VYFPLSHTFNYVKVSPGVLVQQNLELVHMNFKLKEADTSISLESKGFAPGARLIKI
jgi:hypothetical protein